MQKNMFKKYIETINIIVLNEIKFKIPMLTKIAIICFPFLHIHSSISEVHIQFCKEMLAKVSFRVCF